MYFEVKSISTTKLRSMRLSFLLIVSFLFVVACNPAQKLLQQPIQITTPSTKSQDWEFLKAAIGNKRIVAIGESAHGAKEQSQYQLELIKYLHEEMGFNVLAWETSTAGCYIGNHYRAELSDTLLLKHMMLPVWHTQTHLELIQYLKAHPKLQIVGVDLLEQNTPTSLYADFGIQNPDSTTFLAPLRAYYASQAHRYTESTYYGIVRDSLMAETAIFAATEWYPTEKMIVVAANPHIAETESMELYFMGQLLAEHFKSDYYTIALFHATGSPKHIFRDINYPMIAEDLPEESLQYQLLQLKGEAGFIDIKKLKNKEQYPWVYNYVDNKFQTKITIFQPSRTIKLSKSFDAILWMKEAFEPVYVIYNKHMYADKEKAAPTKSTTD